MAVSLMALGLAACGSAGTGGNQAETNESAANAAMADPNNPFGDLEMQMNERMMAAVGADAGDSWAKKMVAHHQGAIDMSELVLQQSPTPDVAEMARMTIAKQRKEIEEIRKLFKNAASNQQSAEIYRPAVADMHRKMMAAIGANVSETFMRKMLDHHRGGVAMSDIALTNGVSGAVGAQVRKTRDDQLKDARMIEAMLAGQSHAQAMAASGAEPATQAKAKPAPADQPKAAARPATSKPTPATEAKTKPKPEPAAPPSTCAPEHRALGHC